MNYSANLLKLLGIRISSTVVEKTKSPEEKLFQAVLLQAFEDVSTLSGSKQESYLKKDAHDWILDNGKNFKNVCWCAGLDPDYVHDRYIKLVKNGSIKFTELQRSWVKYRELYKDYRSANSSSERREIMFKISEVNLKK